MVPAKHGRRVLALGLLVIASLAVIPPPVAAHPYHLQVAFEAGLTTAETVYSTREISQSFLTIGAFLVGRVSLYANNSGPVEPMTVSIRAHDSALNQPTGPDLVVATTTGGDALDWINFTFGSPVPLATTTTYWIVARNAAAASGEGYQWFGNNNAGAYPDGTNKRSNDDITWLPPGGINQDLGFRVYGYVDASVSVSANSTASVLTPGQNVTFQVNLTNTGSGDAERVWVNVTLPAGLVYAGDDAALVGGVRSGSYTYTFSNLLPGTFEFNITATAGGAANGTSANAVISWDPTDHNGAVVGAGSRTFPIMFQNANPAVTLGSVVSLADPGDRLDLTATLSNTGLFAAVNVTTTAPLDTNVSWVPGSGGNYSAGPRTLTWTYATLAAGATVPLVWSTRVSVGAPDQAQILSQIRMQAQDITSAPFPEVMDTNLTTVVAPAFDPILTIDRPTAEHGEIVTATLYHNNTGNGTASRGWANWTLNGHYALVDLTPSLPYETTVDGFSVNRTALVPTVPYALQARLRVLPSYSDGLAMPLEVDWAALDGNGNALPLATRASSVTLHAPVMAVAFTAPGAARFDTSTQIDVTATNSGQGGGRAWLNLTLPANVDFIGTNVSYSFTNVGGVVSISIPSVPAGGVIALSVTVECPGPEGARTFQFTLDYADNGGGAFQRVQSGSVPIRFTATGDGGNPPPGPVPWWPFALIPVVSTILTVIVLRRRKQEASIEDVFVANNSGVLLAHRSSSLIQYQDEDVVVAMFTAVQNFVRDSFSGGVDEAVRSLEFGDRKVLVERGRHHYVAVVFHGKETSKIAARLRALSKQIDDQFGAALENWDGDLDAVRGISTLLAQIWGTRTRTADR